MTIEEWKQTASPEAIAQYEASVDWFKRNVKCCYNCCNWFVDPELMFEYHYNACNRMCNEEKVRYTAYDAYCKHYDGTGTVENLLDYTRINEE